MTSYDAIVIGFGKAGKTLAGSLAKRGRTVALIERDADMYGGTCINVGCIPSKSLVGSAAEAARHADESVEAKAERYAAAIAEKRRVTSLLRGKNYHKLADLDTVDVIDGTASFVAPGTVLVTRPDGTSERVCSRQVFVNTGARPSDPGIPGIEGNPHAYTSETLMDEDVLPSRLTLVGAGYIGMEFASMYASFGSTVTVLQQGETFLPREDADVAEAIRGLLEGQGVRFVLGADITAIEGGNVRYRGGHPAGEEADEAGREHVLAGDAVLVATGRRPNVADLDLAAAGIQLTERGAIKVDGLLRTTAPDVWAMGDVAGSPQFTYASLDDFRIVAQQLQTGDPLAAGTTDGSWGTPDTSWRTTSQRTNVPYSVFMATPLGRAGITEAQASRAGLDFHVLKMPTAAVPKAQVLRQTGGLLKAVVEDGTDRILGVALLMPEAHEVVNLVSLAIDQGLTAGDLASRIYTHPVMCEALNDLFAL
ncbi:MAG: FAD-dependent oxidoreductase [Atopobiaceae bacterium]|jgi:pyruvate/2-oxoglutarate dehydrogenase complex dihydrolipoamide dehydrogenase (E3) component|nr:FAD-dependent oxidoreductase [Atopobiaceae bacterium]MCH4179799.1 FAD-dependent oxidoreductase [Atopobiaceae bacterium]MCH4213550.1 FAD-dependent oxidoreductase [Atopobiaceae bacterium]MCH4229640.1 FAD-dependent oxidoreductase [Atopobiaceae bacterium]MCH4276198.1 FAD-dependent oxidoreductase [Atopobiaceae bacterium]